MQYIAPEKTADAVKLLSKSKGKVHILAGGSDLLVRMKGGYIDPDVIIDIKRIKPMQEIKKTATGFPLALQFHAQDSVNTNNCVKRGQVL